MKALSFRQPWATLIVSGEKVVEWRSWQAKYRGELLVCSSARGSDGYYWYLDGVDAGEVDKFKAAMPLGVAVGVVTLRDVVPFTKRHVKAACMDELPDPRGFAWILENPRAIEQFPVKGKLNFFEVDCHPVPIG